MLTEEEKQDKNKQKEKPVHNKVKRVVFILIVQISESFHDVNCCKGAKVRNLM